ncbi:MAG: decaprenyl-phosphate phosphoribosyltransferase [Oscillospiraceae bacterium]|nr:decaprenyl-phosphate phosphoribosyltransferase [Oscillospiraceae bacterium]
MKTNPNVSANSTGRLKGCINLMRPKHWIKNALVLLPVVTAHQIMNFDILCKAVIGMMVFCFLSSAVYIINDIFDIESDRLHSAKKGRPLASGAVSLGIAYALIGILLSAVIVPCALFFHWNPVAYLLLAAYLLANLAYSVKLKHIPIADITVLASGYALRVYFCSAVTGIPISKWLFLTLVAGAFFLALGKRRGEFRREGTQTRKVLKRYDAGFLDKTMYMCEGMAIVFYSLWTLDGNSGTLIFTVPCLLLVLLRYNLLLERGCDGDPVSTLLSDKALLFLCAAYGLIFMLLLYI